MAIQLTEVGTLISLGTMMATRPPLLTDKEGHPRARDKVRFKLAGIQIRVRASRAVSRAKANRASFRAKAVRAVRASTRVKALPRGTAMASSGVRAEVSIRETEVAARPPTAHSVETQTM